MANHGSKHADRAPPVARKRLKPILKRSGRTAAPRILTVIGRRLAFILERGLTQDSRWCRTQRAARRRQRTLTALALRKARSNSVRTAICAAKKAALAVNTTRLLPQMLAFAYWSLTSCCDAQVALMAPSYQLCSGPRASPQPGRSQNFFRLLLATTLIRTGFSHFGSSVNRSYTAPRTDSPQCANPLRRVPAYQLATKFRKTELFAVQQISPFTPTRSSTSRLSY